MRFAPIVFSSGERATASLVVANPNNCVVFCRACAKTCGPDALSFPNKPEIIALIKQIRERESAK